MTRPRIASIDDVSTDAQAFLDDLDDLPAPKTYAVWAAEAREEVAGEWPHLDDRHAETLADMLARIRWARAGLERIGHGCYADSVNLASHLHTWERDLYFLMRELGVS